MWAIWWQTISTINNVTRRLERCWDRIGVLCLDWCAQTFTLSRMCRKKENQRSEKCSDAYRNRNGRTSLQQSNDGPWQLKLWVSDSDFKRIQPPFQLSWWWIIISCLCFCSNESTFKILCWHVGFIAIIIQYFNKEFPLNITGVSVACLS